MNVPTTQTAGTASMKGLSQGRNGSELMKEKDNCRKRLHCRKNNSVRVKAKHKKKEEVSCALE
jgi:hypothetical protein